MRKFANLPGKKGQAFTAQRTALNSSCAPSTFWADEPVRPWLGGVKDKVDEVSCSSAAANLFNFQRKMIRLPYITKPIFNQSGIYCAAFSVTYPRCTNARVPVLAYSLLCAVCGVWSAVNLLVLSYYILCTSYRVHKQKHTYAQQTDVMIPSAG